MLSNDFCVNDLLSGTSTIEEAITLQQELSSLLQTAGLTLRTQCWPQQHPYLILSDYWIQLSLPTRYFYRNCGKKNYNGMISCLFTCNKNGINWFKLFLSYHKSRWTERSSAPMLPTSNFMDSVTAASEPTEPVCTFAVQTTTRTHLVNYFIPHQRLHHWSN